MDKARWSLAGSAVPAADETVHWAWWVSAGGHWSWSYVLSSPSSSLFGRPQSLSYVLIRYVID